MASILTLLFVLQVTSSDLKRERLAVEFLAKEVPAWRPANGCFSCHNNGDGARAVFMAKSAKLPVDPAAIRQTIEFLKQPSEWDSNGPDGPFNDRQLARLQFAHALAIAVQEGFVTEREPLLAAAERLVADQKPNGVWEFAGEDVIGSPVTYGRPLATAIALRILRQADAQRFAKPIASGQSWLIELEPRSVLNCAAIILGLVGADDPAAAAQREKCLQVIASSQTREGGWGPYVNSPPEPFDTALVICALHELDRERWGDAIKAGRQFLIATQYSDGSWPETTRPPGGDSYAQRIGTSAWATIALIKSQ